MQAYPKIFSIGTDYIRDIFKDPVVIEEKVDGSQFAFGMINYELYMRSKGKQLFLESPEKMFLPAMEYVDSIKHRLTPNIMYYCEYLQRPRHNALQYKQIPKNHLVLFGMMEYPTQRFLPAPVLLAHVSAKLDIDVIPVLYEGRIDSLDQLMQFLERESYLGGAQIEGVVVKNYHQPFLLGGQPIPLMAGKFVSEKFKEVHRSSWSKEHTTGGKWAEFVESFRTEARWQKAVQHLRDNGELSYSPKDIGSLIKEVNKDILAEEEETIKEFLWKHFGKDILRRATAGLPEWYKEELMQRSFDPPQ
jgi:hypothetical protein